MSAETYLTLKQAAAESGVSYAALRREVEAGRLPAFRAGRKYFLSQAALTEFRTARGAAPVAGYTVRQLTERLPLSYAFLMELIHRGELQAQRVGRRYLVTEEALQAFLAANQTGAGEPEDE